jgi:hypothetical protein
MHMKLPVLDFLNMNSLQFLYESKLFMFHQLIIARWVNCDRPGRAV